VLGGFQAPMDVVALPNGSLLVADFGNDRVQRLIPQAAPVTMPSVVHVVHAATNQEGAVAPGEIVSLYGAGFTPPCTVTVGEAPAWLLYVGSSQINAVLPGELAAGTSLEVRCGDTLKGSASLDVVPSNPGLFAVTGHLAALNQDGAANSETNPAPHGSIVSLFGTGLGTAQTVAATIGGASVEVLYAGSAPGLPGVFQVNARIPETVNAGEVEVRVTASGLTSPAGLTISVR
jgi:uncharacterized protein (TIGR03437 family)